MIDPMRRWGAYGEKPDYAGLLTFGGLPYTEDPVELAGAHAAIFCAAMDVLMSDPPGWRFGRAPSPDQGCAMRNSVNAPSPALTVAVLPSDDSCTVAEKLLLAVVPMSNMPAQPLVS